MKDVALVLEGGGLRAIYTAGVLDAFLQQSLHFSYVIGVYAGAIYPASYGSRQFGRNLHIQQQYLNDKRYMGVRHWLATGNYVNTDFTYRRMAYELLPFDFDTFLNKQSKPSSFRKIKRHLDKEGMTYLSDSYFQEIANKIAIMC